MNQYNEDVTSTYGSTINWTASTGGTVSKPSNGKLIVTNAPGVDFLPGAKIYLTGVHAASATVVNAEVTVGLESKANEVLFKGVYNKSKSKMENLPAGFAANTYQLLFKVNDQYGNEMSTVNSSDLVFTSNNPMFVNSTLTMATSTVVVDGETYHAVDIARGSMPEKGGEVTVQAISTVTGKTSTYVINSDALSQVATFTMSAPEGMIAEGETIEIPFTAVDQYGNAVTKHDQLVAQVTPSGTGLAFVKQNDGTTKLKYTAPTGTAGLTDSIDLPVYLSTIVPANGNFSSLLLNVKKEARAVAVLGLDADTSTSIAAGNSVKITYKNILAQDQYGRTMSADKLKAWLDAPGNNSIVVNSEIIAGTDSSAFDVSSTSTGANSAQVVLANSTDELYVKAKTGTGLNSTEKITFALSNSTTTVGGTTTPVILAGSEKAVTFSKVSQSEYVSYTVDDLGTMYINAGGAASASHNKTLKVYGVKEDGTKVLLPTTDYSVTTSAGTTKLAVTSNVISQVNNAYVATDFEDVAAGKPYADIKVEVLVTIAGQSGSAADVISKELLLSNKAIKAETITVDADKVTDGKATITANNVSNATLNSFIKEVKDQYGVVTTEAPIVTITNLSKVDGSTLTVSGNGTTGTNITGATMGDKFTATYKYASSGKTVAIEFTVGLDNVAPSLVGSVVYTDNDGDSTFNSGDTFTFTFDENVQNGPLVVGLTSASTSVAGNVVTLTLTGTESDGTTFTLTVKDSTGNERAVSYTITTP